MIPVVLEITAVDGWYDRPETRTITVRDDESVYQAVERVVEELAPNGFEEFTVKWVRPKDPA